MLSVVTSLETVCTVPRALVCEQKHTLLTLIITFGFLLQRERSLL